MSIDNFPPYKVAVDGKSSWCRSCHRVAQKKWLAKKIMEDPGYQYRKVKTYLAVRTDLKQQHSQRWQAAQCNELRDGYVRKLLRLGTSLKREDIPICLVEAKRAQLKIERFLKGNK